MEEQLSVGSWHHRSNAAVRGLVSRGVQVGDRVALVFDNARWLDLAVGYLAVLKAGGVAVPLAPRFAGLDLDRALRHSGSRLVVCPADLRPSTDTWECVEVTALEAGQSSDPYAVEVNGDAPAEMLFEEGAMRRPVPFTSSHGDLLAARGLPAPSPGPFVHAFASGTPAGRDALLLPLRVDNTVSVVLPAFDSRRFCALVVRHQATGCGLTPPMARTLLRSGQLAEHDLSRVRRFVLSRPAGWAGLQDAVSHALPDAEIGHVHPPTVSSELSQGGQSEIAPLAAAQDGMVWHEQFTPGSFNLSPPVRRLRGHLDVKALELALNEIVRRHPALRTTFSIVDGHAVQVFPPPTGFELPVVDVSGLSDAEQHAALGRLVADARSRPFDLVMGPPFQPVLVRLGSEDHVMVLRTHHAVYDDWSVGVFRRELAALYNAFVAGEPSPLPEIPVHLPDVVRRRASALEGETGEVERTFWRRELEGAPLSVQLPIDDPSRPAGSPHQAPAPISLELPPDLAGALRGVAKNQRATLFMVLLAAFGVLVQRYTGQDDLLVSTLAANRPDRGLEDLIGCFGKKVLVRLRLTDDPIFPELVTRTRRALMGALAHQGLAYESVLQEMLGPDAAAHGLVPQVALKFQAAITPREGLALSGLTTGAVHLAPPEREAHFLAGDAEPDGPGWGCGLYLNVFLGLSVVEADDGVRLVTEGVFHAPEVERLLAHFRILLADIATDPSRRLSELALVETPEPRPVRIQDDVSSEKASVPDAFDAQVRRTPGRTAVVFGDRHLSYAELAGRAENLAGRLQAAGVGPETPVALLVASGIDQVTGVIAIWKAGGAIVPLDPNDAPDVASAALSSAGCSVVVSDSTFPGAATTVTVGNGSGERSRPLPTVLASSHLAWIHFDPTTGNAVEIEHRSLRATRDAVMTAVYPPGAEGQRIGAAALPRSGTFARALLALTGGHTVHMTPHEPRDGIVWLPLIESGVIDVIDCRPDDVASLLDGGLQATLDRRSGGQQPVLVVDPPDGSVSPEVWTTWRHIRGASVHLLFGPAECSFGATSCLVPAATPRPGIGRPLPHARVSVVDPLGRPVPTRAPGALEVGGAAVARGYRNAPALTAERFGCGEDDRVFRTGRLARPMPDGTIGLLARPGARVDLRGFQVEPARIEAALAGSADVAQPTLGRLRRRLWEKLPGYAWPASVVGAGTGRASTDGVAEGGEEAIDVALLTEAWAEVAGVERVGTDTNYWQSFAFLDALAEAHSAGSPIETRHVTRNRILETLGTDLLATGPSRDVRSRQREPDQKADDDHAKQ